MEDLDNLQQWQAISHPDLAERKPDELFESEFAERYGRMHNDLWQRIVRLHGTIRTLETLADFPFDYLYGPNDMEFWRLVGHNFVEMAIVLLHGLMEDQGTDAHTIPRFKNEIVADKGQWLDPRMRDVLVKTLRDRKPDRRVESLAERVQEIRHKRIAHRLIDRKTGHLKGRLDGVSLREFRNLFDGVHSLFGALSFGSAYATLTGDLMPGTIGGKPKRTCIDKVLDAVLRDSDFVNKPEREPCWPELRKQRTPEELKILNECRKRLGLPEV